MRSNENLSINTIWQLQHEAANWHSNGNHPNLIHQALQNVQINSTYLNEL